MQKNALINFKDPNSQQIHVVLKLQSISHRAACLVLLTREMFITMRNFPQWIFLLIITVFHHSCCEIVVRFTFTYLSF